MSISAQAVKELREKTGCGFMDCKNALAETSGDVESAIEYLRKKGMAAAAKKAHRATSEGLIEAFLSDDGKTGSLVEVNCETDFVARTDDFRNLVIDLARQAAESGESASDADALLAQPFFKDTSQTVQDVLNATVGKIGENMRLKRFARFACEGEGMVDAYIHPGSKIGVLIEVSSPGVAGDAEEFRTLVRDLAMQVAAASPLAVTPDDLPAEIVAKEREILAEQARESGKPENIIEKMVEGRIKKYFEESCLLQQKFIKDQDRTVQEVVEAAVARLGGDITVNRFQRFQLGRD